MRNRQQRLDDLIAIFEEEKAEAIRIGELYTKANENDKEAFSELLRKNAKVVIRILLAINAMHCAN